MKTTTKANDAGLNGKTDSKKNLDETPGLDRIFDELKLYEVAQMISFLGKMFENATNGGNGDIRFDYNETAGAGRLLSLLGKRADALASDFQETINEFERRLK
jgi:hypothetical protein